MSNSVEAKVTNATNTVGAVIKKSIYDLLSLAIVVAIIVASLDAFGLREINDSTIKHLVMEWLPFFFASVLLDTNLYNKGKFVGKLTKNFANTVKAYSDIVSDLTGDQIRTLPYFCGERNNETLRKLQTATLKAEGICFDEFDCDHNVIVDNKTEKRKALKTCTSKELKKYGFTFAQRCAIRKAKKLKIVGLKVNLLLGSYVTDDDTDLGPTEEQISFRRRFFSILGYIGSTAIMTIIGVKDVMQWGWAGLIIVVFKTAYTFVKSYMSYFKGYGDIVVVSNNHVARKTDWLKDFLTWYDELYKIGNKIEIQE